MNNISTLKNALRNDPETAKMIKPSAKNEIFMDWDTTGSGEFDLYLTDTDGNGIADDVCFYSDGSDEPDLTFGGQEVEAELEDATIKFTQILRKKNANVIELISALRIYKGELVKLAE